MTIDTSFYSPDNPAFVLDAWLPKSRIRKCRTPEMVIATLCDLYHKNDPVGAEAFAKQMEVMRSFKQDKKASNKFVGSIPEFIYHGAELIQEVRLAASGDEWESFWTPKNTDLFFKMYRVGSVEDNGRQK